MIGAIAKLAGGFLKANWGKVALFGGADYATDGLVHETAIDITKKGAQYVSKKENREAVRETITGAAAGIKEGGAAIGDAVEVIRNPEKKLTEALMGSDEKNPDGTNKNPGILSRIFKDKDGSINWVNTALTAAAGYWGGGKLMNVFGGGNDKDGESGGLFGGGALKLGIMAAVGYMIYSNFDKIKSFFGNIMDGFNKKASEIGGSNGVNIGMDPTGRTKTLAEMDLSVPAGYQSKSPLGQEFQGKTMNSPSVTRAQPAGLPEQAAQELDSMEPAYE